MNHLSAVPSADGSALLAETRRATAADPLDAGYLDDLCQEIDNRIIRGDMLIGILPVQAEEVLVRGWAAAASERPQAWVRLGRSLFRLPAGQPVVWPSPPPFPTSGDEVLDAALSCFAEAARRGVREGAYLFAAAGRPAVQRVGTYALSLLAPLRADDPTGEARYWSGIIWYLSGEADAAVTAHHQAAADGNADAMFELSVLYGTGDGVPQDDAVAQDWLLRAADQEHPRALYNVAAAHATGRGLAKDDAAAASYYERAAKAGNPRAAATLGVMHLLGNGLPRDPERAARWLDWAEADGFDVDGWLDQLGLTRPS